MPPKRTFNEEVFLCVTDQSFHMVLDPSEEIGLVQILSTAGSQLEVFSSVGGHELYSAKVFVGSSRAGPRLDPCP